MASDKKLSVRESVKKLREVSKNGFRTDRNHDIQLFVHVRCQLYPNNCDREKTSGFPLLWVCFSCNISPNLTRRWENFDFNFVLYVYKLIDCSPYIRAYAKIQNLRNLFALEAPRQLGGHAVEIIDNGLVTFTFISNHNNNFIASLS